MEDPRRLFIFKEILGFFNTIEWTSFEPIGSYKNI